MTGSTQSQVNPQMAAKKVVFRNVHGLCTKIDSIPSKVESRYGIITAPLRRFKKTKSPKAEKRKIT